MKNTLTRADLREAIYNSCRVLSRAQARKIFDHVIEEIADSLARGETVRLHEFGVFKVRRKQARLGRNPRTRVDCEITARSVVAFKPSPVMVARVNATTESQDDGRTQTHDVDAYRRHGAFEPA